VLRVSIELLPGGGTTGAQELAAVAIARTADTSAGYSTYAALLERAAGPSLGATVVHLPRHGATELVRRVLAAASIDGVAELSPDVRGHLARVATLRDEL
jgi:hypothetical protein